MEPYSPMQLMQPLQAPPVPKPSSQSVRSILRHVESTPLAPIREEPRLQKRLPPDPAELHAKALEETKSQALKEQVRVLLAQRDEAFEALDTHMASAAALQKAHIESAKAHERQGAEWTHRSNELEAKTRCWRSGA